MNDNLNLVEILENCPKGTKLYSTMYGEVKFLGINTHIDTIYNIEFKAENGALSSVTPEGKYFDDLNGECTLFPSKYQRDWSKFTAPWYNIEKQDKQKKQVHFPKFTFDDVLALQCCMETVKKVQEDKELYEKLNLIHSKIYDAYWLEKQGEQILSQTNHKKDRFDPKTLKPFDRVLVRDKDCENWNCGFFSHKDASSVYHYRCIGTPYIHCIPYNEETKHLVGTNEEAPEFYRYWKD